MTAIMGSKAKKGPKRARNLHSFIGDLKGELKKVSWTTKSELFFATKTVIFSMFGFGIGIYLVDLFIKGILEGIKRMAFFIAR